MMPLLVTGIARQARNVITPRRSAAAALIGLMASLLLAPLAAFAAGNKAGVCESVRSSGKTTSLERCDFPGSNSDPEAAARRFIDAQQGFLGMLHGSAELAHVGTSRGLGGQYIRFQQVLAGYPVYDGLLTIIQNRGGRIRGLHSNYNAEAIQRYATPIRTVITRDAAEQIARQAVAQATGAPAQDLDVRHARQLWFPRPDSALALAWELTITAALPSTFVDMLIIVDVTTREVLLQQDRREFFAGVQGRGKIFAPIPYRVRGTRPSRT